MRIAISTDENVVSVHFGRCPAFTIVDVENGAIVKKDVVENPGHHPGFIPEFLHQKGVNCIVSGGMGRRATQLFNSFGIETIVGVTGTIDEVVEKLQTGMLAGGESLCQPGAGKGYGLDKTECDHPKKKEGKNE